MGRVRADENLQAYPAPAEGTTRYVVHLPEQEDESVYQVELIVGKTVEVDERNRYFFAGEIQETTIAGWGFPRYDVAQLGPMAGTLIAVDPEAPRVPRFVRLRGEPYLIRYNSKLPIVLYVPSDAEVRYRVWTAGAVAPMPQG
jgi:ecotin